MKCIELEFNNKLDLEALGLSVNDIREDIKLLDNLGFDFNRNIIQYLHEAANDIRYFQSEG